MKPVILGPAPKALENGARFVQAAMREAGFDAEIGPDGPGAYFIRIPTNWHPSERERQEWDAARDKALDLLGW